MEITEYQLELEINGCKIERVCISQHYRKKHASYMTDALILELVVALDGGIYPVDSFTREISYYAADVALDRSARKRTYRIIWLLEGDKLEILGVVNAYRRKPRKK